MTNIFNVRVYGLLINKKNEILISDEHVYGRNITKFPGGGLQFGEGTIDCLKREFKEELNVEINIKSHFYTTDFFQPSAFNSKQQIISIYYFVELLEKIPIKVSSLPFDFPEIKDGIESFRWLNLSNAKEEDVTFPIDRKVILMLKSKNI